MAARGVAKRYAQAVFEIASEAGTQDAWLVDLTTLATVAQDSAGGEFFTSPSVNQSDKRAAINQLLPGADKQLARNLAHLLIQRHRFDTAPEILDVFRDLMLEAQGIAIAEVTTAIELTDAERASIAARLSQLVGRQIEMRTRVQPEILGGIIARIGDRLIDGSVLSQLRSLRASVAR